MEKEDSHHPVVQNQDKNFMLKNSENESMNTSESSLEQFEMLSQKP